MNLKVEVTLPTLNCECVVDLIPHQLQHHIHFSVYFPQTTFYYVTIYN